MPATDRRTARVVLMRYEEQGHELPIASHGDDPAALAAGLASAHSAVSGFDLRGVAI